MNKKQLRKKFKETVEYFITVRDNMGSSDAAKRQEAHQASMNVRKQMQDLYSRDDSDYICKVFKRYNLT